MLSLTFSRLTVFLLGRHLSIRAASRRSLHLCASPAAEEPPNAQESQLSPQRGGRPAGLCPASVPPCRHFPGCPCPALRLEQQGRAILCLVSPSKGLGCWHRLGGGLGSDCRGMGSLFSGPRGADVGSPSRGCWSQPVPLWGKLCSNIKPNPSRENSAL